MKRSILALVAATTCALAAPASALQYTWDFANGAVSAPVDDPSACGPSGNTAKCQLNLVSTTGGLTMYARAYATTSSAITGNLVSANIVRYNGGGLGVQNVAGDSYETSSPEHAVDNQDRKDVIVFEAPSDNFDWSSIALGWARENVSGTWYNQADIQLYTGGNGIANLDFSTMCFSGCSTSSNNIQTAFKSLGTFNNVAQGSSANLDPTNDPTKKGRYLVVSGALGNSNDYFKISTIKGSVPEPQTLLLVGLGLLGMLGFQRRSARN